VRTLKITLWYDGTAFSGWQRQEEARTVQAVLEEAIAAIEGTPVTVTGAGRTDAGVHAAAQVASARIESRLAAADLLRAINARLPEDVRVREVHDVPDTFDARRGALSKTYRYALWLGAEPGPFLRHVVWHIDDSLDVEAMMQAAVALDGEHDFAAFQSTGSSVATSVRRVLSSRLELADLHTGLLLPASGSPDARLLCYEVTATGFLRHMVRAIVGTLVEIGRGRWTAQDLKRILASRERAQAGPTAPPHGLMLWKVHY
jgi:tRNA pseudouridine38-40 synthase